MFPPFKRGGGAQKVLPCLEGGGAQKVSNPRFSHFVAPPVPIINDQSLKFLHLRVGYLKCALSENV